MNRRHGHILLALLVGPWAPVGCARWQYLVPPTIVPPPSAAASNGEMPTAQAAQLCLTAGEALEKKGFTAEAIQQYENARKHNPQARNVTRHLAVLYDLHGDTARAEAEYDRALQDCMVPVKASAALTRAEAEYVQALQKHGGDVELLNDIGYFHCRHGHLEAAESWLRSAVAANPGYACAWVNLGQVLARQGRTEESYQAFAHALRPAEAYSNLGVVLAKQGHTAEARRALQQAVTLDPHLEQPRAFLNALSPTPALLPPSIRHSAAPAQPKPATPTVSAPPPALSLPRTALDTPPRVPVRASAPTPLIPLPSPRTFTPCSSPPLPLAPAAATGGPIIVNGPIRPIPVSCSPRLVPTPAPMPGLPAKTLGRHSPPPAPPPPPPPPAASRPSANTDGSILIRTSASSIQPALTQPRGIPRTWESIPPLPLPLAPPSTPLIRTPSRPQVQPAPRKPTPPPKATLIDCQGEQQPENSP